MSMTFFDRRRRRGGFLRRAAFTLLELIVVITIIGILGTFVVMRVTVWADKARIQKIKTDLHTIYRAAEMWKVEMGSWPSSLEDLKSGKTQDGKDMGASVEKAKDPWQNEYLYELGTDGTPRIRCLGKDNAEGGDGENKDYEYPEVEGT